MNAKDFEALVNKGAITHVGINVENMSDKEVAERYITKHEVAAEFLGACETPVEPEVPEVPEEPVKDIKVITSTEGTMKVGEIITTKVSLESEKYAGTMIRVRGTIVPAGASKLKYKEGEEWLDLPVEGNEEGVFYFGASAGFPLTNGAESEFHSELLLAGDVTTTLEIIDVATGEVIGSDSQTVTVGKATKKATAKKASAPVVDPVE